jgi:hypothetical protein
MSAQWLPVLASPKTSNKHIGRKGQMTFSADSFDKLVSSAAVHLQSWPRIIPDSDQFRVAVETAFPGFWIAAESVGRELSSRLVMAAGKAAETGAAVKIPAGEVFLYKAQQLGFKKKRNHSYLAEYERARQFVQRRGGGSSAARILKRAVSDLGLSSHCSIAIYAEPGATHIVLIPSPADADIGRIYTAGCSSSFRLALSEKVSGDNHVSDYMSTVPVQRHVSCTSRAQIFKLIDERCQHPGYRALLKESVATGLASDFRSTYAQEAQSSRIFATGASMQFMPGWLRSALFPDWFEMDFSNMHLSILNSQANLGLDLSTSIWNQILDAWEPTVTAAGDALGRESMLTAAGIRHLFTGQMNSGSSKSYFFDASKFDRAALKKILKVSLYSLQFGMTAPAARRAFTGDLLGLGFSRAEATFLGNLWSADPLLQKIATGISAFCKEAGLNPSELALRCQAFETDLVKEIYATARSFSRNDICITLHSHDGVSVWARKPGIGRRFYRKCVARCARALQKAGIQSRLEAKGLPASAKIVRAPVRQIATRLVSYSEPAMTARPQPRAAGPP